MVIRLIHNKDIKNLLILLSHIKDRAFFTYTEKLPTSHQIKRFIHNPCKKFYVLENNDMFIGYYIVTLGIYPENIHVAKIQSMGVASNQQDRGYGKIMLSDIIKKLKKKGKKIITLEVISNNVPAIKLYKSVGFLECGRIKNAFIKKGNKYDLILMSLKV